MPASATYLAAFGAATACQVASLPLHFGLDMSALYAKKASTNASTETLEAKPKPKIGDLLRELYCKLQYKCQNIWKFLLKMQKQ